MWRRQLLAGLRDALDELERAGCRTVYLDGSFVTEKVVPGDFDACWETNGIDCSSIDPILLEFSDNRASQKAKYGGEMFPVTLDDSNPLGPGFLGFFQTDKDSGSQKGLIALDLGGPG